MRLRIQQLSHAEVQDRIDPHLGSKTAELWLAVDDFQKGTGERVAPLSGDDAAVGGQLRGRHVTRPQVRRDREEEQRSFEGSANEMTQGITLEHVVELVAKDGVRLIFL